MSEVGVHPRASAIGSTVNEVDVSGKVSEVDASRLVSEVCTDHDEAESQVVTGNQCVLQEQLPASLWALAEAQGQESVKGIDELL